ncbi:MAG: hypothetical protein AMK71_08255 [Nitrospira bacterium SG8_35_4]|nr:MAG: hypothetical protein AMK71_08255 [Nitrospira bacterium SG8_35_4]
MVDLSVVKTAQIPIAVESHDTVGAVIQRHEVVFVDAGVPDYQQLVREIVIWNYLRFHKTITDKYLY